MSLSLQDVLEHLDTPAEKTASAYNAAPTSQTAVAAAELSAALKSAEAELSHTSQEKTAAAALEEMANKLASAEQDLMTKEAHIYGAAMADGFVTRLASYDAQVSLEAQTAATQEKTAEAFATGVIDGYLRAQNGEITKTAGDAASELRQLDPELVKFAADVIDGFTEATQSSGAASYEDGVTKTAAALNDATVDCYRRGFEDCDSLLGSLREPGTKTADLTEDLKNLDASALARRATHNPSQTGIAPALLGAFDPLAGGIAGGWNEAHPWKRGLATGGGGTLGTILGAGLGGRIGGLPGVFAGKILGGGLGSYGGYKLSE